MFSQDEKTSCSLESGGTVLKQSSPSSSFEKQFLVVAFT